MAFSLQPRCAVTRRDALLPLREIWKLSLAALNAAFLPRDRSEGFRQVAQCTETLACIQWDGADDLGPPRPEGKVADERNVSLFRYPKVDSFRRLTKRTEKKVGCRGGSC